MPNTSTGQPTAGPKSTPGNLRTERSIWLQIEVPKLLGLRRCQIAALGKEVRHHRKGYPSKYITAALKGNPAGIPTEEFLNPKISVPARRQSTERQPDGQWQRKQETAGSTYTSSE